MTTPRPTSETSTKFVETTEALQVGDTAPAFSLPDANGTPHALKDYLGKWVLVYFYPKDDTPGCTIEACSLRDNFPAFEKLKCTILGISADDVRSHNTFAKKFNLNFTLLADKEKQVVTQYGVWQKKKMMGREYMGIVRWSFLINPKGVIAKIYENVKPSEHAQEVLNDLKMR